MSLEETIYAVVADRTRRGLDEIGPGFTLTADHGIDSLSFVELGLAIETAIGMRLPDDELAAVTTAGDLVALCRRKLADGQSTAPVS